MPNSPVQLPPHVWQQDPMLLVIAGVAAVILISLWLGHKWEVRTRRR